MAVVVYIFYTQIPGGAVDSAAADTALLPCSQSLLRSFVSNRGRLLQ
jgi:hypothetical protein